MAPRRIPFFRPATYMDLSVTSIQWALAEYRRNMLRTADTLFVSADNLEWAKDVMDYPELKFHLNIHTISGWPVSWWSVGEALIYGWGSEGAC